MSDAIARSYFRRTIFAAALVAAGILTATRFLEWFPRQREATAVKAAESVSPPSVSSDARGASDFAALAGAPFALTPLGKLRWLAAQARDLSPQDRDLADELRCALSASVTAANAEAVVRGLGDEADGELGWLALSRWADAQPLRAEQWLEAQVHPSTEQIDAVACALAKDSAAIATLLATSRARDATRDPLLAAVARATVSIDPARAAEIAARLTAGPLQTTTLRLIADAWTRSEPERARAWIESVNNSPRRGELFDVAAEGLAATDPLVAVRWVLNASASDAEISHGLQVVTATWARFAPEEATRFSVLADLAAEQALGFHVSQTASAR